MAHTACLTMNKENETQRVEAGGRMSSFSSQLTWRKSALIRCVLHYYSVGYGSAVKSLLHKLHIMQIQALRECNRDLGIYLNQSAW